MFAIRHWGTWSPRLACSAEPTKLWLEGNDTTNISVKQSWWWDSSRWLSTDSTVMANFSSPPRTAVSLLNCECGITSESIDKRWRNKEQRSLPNYAYLCTDENENENDNTTHSGIMPADGLRRCVSSASLRYALWWRDGHQRPPHRRDRATLLG